MNPTIVTDFWRGAGPKRWFRKDPAFDREIEDRFEPAHHAAARGEYPDWQNTADGALALVLVLDQFPRNIWRNSPHAYAADPLSRQIARFSIDCGHDRATETALRAFFYLPFEHSEDLADQDLSVALNTALQRDGGGAADWAHKHRDVIIRFGRFPHRNAALGRASTPEELAWLTDGGFAG